MSSIGTEHIEFKEVIEKVRIDLNRARFWDITAISALDAVILKFRREGTEVEVTADHTATLRIYLTAAAGSRLTGTETTDLDLVVSDATGQQSTVATIFHGKD